MSYSSIQPIHRTLSGASTPGRSGLWSNGNEGVLRIPQSYNISEDLPSDCFTSYQGHSLWESYCSAEMQPVYSTATVDWAKCF